MNDGSRHLLLLAGSGEARALAKALKGRAGWRVTASLLHPPRAFGPLAVPTRIGPFGGADGLRRYIAENDVAALLDATHPFANRMAAHAAEVAAQTGLPHLRLLRPPWTPEPGDTWRFVPDEAQAARLLQPGQRVFTNIGRATLGLLVTDPQVTFLARQLADRDPPDQMANVRYITGTAPFTVEEEIALFRELKIDVLVTKNAGGEPSRSKLDAARALGMPVILIDRPAPPPGVDIAETVAEALDWVASL